MRESSGKTYRRRRTVESKREMWRDERQRDRDREKEAMKYFFTGLFSGDSLPPTRT